MEELPGLYFMRARYYSAEAGVFLSTDPVKHIGPGWKPTAYGYADGNPMRDFDANGNEPITLSTLAVASIIGGAIGGGSSIAMDMFSGNSIDWQRAGIATVAGAVAAPTAKLVGAGAVALGIGKAGALAMASVSSASVKAGTTALGEQVAYGEARTSVSEHLGNIAIDSTLGFTFGQAPKVSGAKGGFVSQISFTSSHGDAAWTSAAQKSMTSSLMKGLTSGNNDQQSKGGNGQQSTISGKAAESAPKVDYFNATQSKSTFFPASSSGSTSSGSRSSSSVSAGMCISPSPAKKNNPSPTPPAPPKQSIVQKVTSFFSKFFGGGKKK